MNGIWSYIVGGVIFFLLVGATVSNGENRKQKIGLAIFCLLFLAAIFLLPHSPDSLRPQR